MYVCVCIYIYIYIYMCNILYTYVIWRSSLPGGARRVETDAGADAA